MSIYALPGPLFKLVSSGRSTPKPKESVEIASSSEGQSSSSLSVADCVENPLHRRRGSGSTSQLDASDSSHASGSGRHGNSNVVIAVKEAKIDPERLIRSLSQSSSDSKKSASSKSKAAGETLTEDSKPAPGSGSSSSQRRRRKQGDSHNDCCKCDPHEEAIKFEISVSFNGREYTATRTLPRILQFRYDLIEEFRARQMWRERRRKRKESVPPQMAAVRDVSDDEEDDHQSIPEIPRLSEDAAGSSGFTMLNALLRPYGPALERWMTKVIDIVPHDSQCLTQFLWEPLAGNAVTSKKDERTRERRRSSLSTLVAIQETEDLEQYDSDTDEYLLIH